VRFFGLRPQNDIAAQRGRDSHLHRNDKGLASCFLPDEKCPPIVVFTHLIIMLKASFGHLLDPSC